MWLDQTLVDDVLVREGYAHEYTYGKPYAYQARFLADQAAAKAQGLGLWSASTCNGDTTH